MISGSHHRISSHHHQGVGFTRQAPESPASTYGSDDSEPNDLSTGKSHPSHHPGSASYPYYSPPHHGSSQQSPYTATNDCRIIEYRGHRIAAFLSVATTKHPAEYLLCLPQAFELFLKHLVGGLHTVYTKLKVSFWTSLSSSLFLIFAAIFFFTSSFVTLTHWLTLQSC